MAEIPLPESMTEKGGRQSRPLWVAVELWALFSGQQNRPLALVQLVR